MLKKEKPLNSIVLLITMFILVYGVMPLVRVFVSSYLTTYIYMLLLVFLVFYIVFAAGMKSMTYYFPIMFPFLLYIAVGYFLNSGELVNWVYQQLLFIMPIIIGYYLFNEKSKHINKFAVIVIIVLLITIITTTVGLIRYPFASRTLATISDSNNEEMLTYYWNNIGGYEFVYTIVLLYPLLIYAYKKGKINLFFTIVLTALLYLFLIYAEYTTALLLVIITSCLFFVKKEFSKKGVLVFAIITLIVIALCSELFSDLLIWLSDVIDSEAVSYRLKALAGGVEGIENSEDNRVALYQISLTTFLSNPIFGSLFKGFTYNSGHSAILDCMANLGAIGIFLMIWMYRSIYFTFIKPQAKGEGRGFVLWFFVQALILSAVNAGFFFEVLVLYGPLILALINRPKKSEEFDINKLGTTELSEQNVGE